MTSQREKDVLKDERLRLQVQKLVIARLSAIPKDLQISVGSKQYTVEDLQKFVKEDNEIGRQLMESQLKYLREMASGKIYKMWSNEQDNTYNQAKL